MRGQGGRAQAGDTRVTAPAMGAIMVLPGVKAAMLPPTGCGGVCALAQVPGSPGSRQQGRVGAGPWLGLVMP